MQNTNHNMNLIDFFKQKSHSYKSNASCEKTLPIKSPIMNNFLEKTTKSKKCDQHQKFNEKNKAVFLKSCENCTFCTTLKLRAKAYLMISSALQIKHTPNLHYHITKNINDLIQNKRTAKVIFYKDMVVYNDEQEYFKRLYKSIEQPSRIKNLTEFYQYHTEIPKLHIYSLRHILKRYHTKKRKLEYIFVRKLLGFSINKDILESSYEQKNNDEESNENDKNKKVIVTNILQDISVAKESFRKILEERKSSISFNEFSRLNAKEDKKLDFKDFATMLQKLTENSFEAFKPELLNKNYKTSKTSSEFNFKKTHIIPQHQRFSSNLAGTTRPIEKSCVEKAIEKKLKSNTDRNYDFKVKTTRKTINLLTEPNNNPMLSPKSPIIRINSDRNTRSQTKELLKSTSSSIPKKRNSPFSASTTNGASFHKKENKNKVILHKKTNFEKTSNSNSHLRFFSLNGYDSSKHENSTTREGIKSPKEVPGFKKLQKLNSVNILINKKFVKAHLEEFLLMKATPQLRNSNSKISMRNDLLQGKNTQNLFKKIYQNDLKSPKKLIKP